MPTDSGQLQQQSTSGHSGAGPEPKPDEVSPFTLKSALFGLIGVLCIGLGAPYGYMLIRGSSLAFDFSTAGAVFLFFLLVGGVNVALRLVHRRLALGRGQLLAAYTMMTIACSIATMGLSGYLPTIITAAQYYATPENEWADLILPYVPRWMVPQDDRAIQWFYEGAPRGASIPWGVWVQPLISWAVLILALYLVMISVMVILRKQWMEGERLIYPIAQVPLAVSEDPAPGKLVPPFFRSPIMWAGFSLPVIVSTLQGLHAYFNFVPLIQLTSSVPVFRNTVNLIFRASFPMMGFSYLLNLDVAFSLWFFNILANVVRGALNVLGITSTEQLGIYGVRTQPILEHQGQGAMIILVIFGLYVARRHLADVFRKAFRGDPGVDDSREIMSYRAAVFSLLGGLTVMSIWVTLSGLALWAAILTVLMALLIFVGLTRIVVEGGVATAVGPMISSSFMTSAVGSSLLGPQGLVGLAYSYVWAADIRTFVMASAAHGLKLSESMGARRRLRPLFWYMAAAIVVALVASLWMILYLAYHYGGINLSSWFFGGGCRAPFNYISIFLNTPTSPNWEGLVHTAVGGLIMGGLMLARHQFPWWPLHPIGYPIGAVWLMDELWVSIFIAWLVKLVVMKYGGPSLYRTTRPFFLGMIMGQFAIAGLWLLIDYFTGMTDNRVFWI